MTYSKEQRDQIIADIKTKEIEDLEYYEAGEYWTLIFTDASYLSFRLMAELV